MRRAAPLSVPGSVGQWLGVLTPELDSLGSNSASLLSGKSGASDIKLYEFLFPHLYSGYKISVPVNYSYLRGLVQG